MTSAAYLKENGVIAALEKAVETVLHERPKDPIAAIATMLRAPATAKPAVDEDDDDDDDEQMRAALQKRLSSSDPREALRAAEEELKKAAAAEREAEFLAWEEEQAMLAALGKRLSSSDTRVCKAAEEEVRELAEAEVKGVPLPSATRSVSFEVAASS